MPQPEQADYDSPWKDIIEQFFEQCLLFFFPRIYKQIEWSKGFSFLDKEFQKISKDAETTRQTVDKLVKVYLLGGEELWLLIHIEVQSQRDQDFAARMFTYHYRIFDKYHRQVVSLALLADEHAAWRPSLYEEKNFGCEVRLKFPIIKLLDYRAKLPQLERSQNPFALVVLAHLRALETKRAPQKRMLAKLQLIRLMRGRGFTKKHIADLLRFIDWVLTLPAELERQLTDTVEKEEENMKRQKYVTSWERMGEAKGLEQGLEQGQIKSLRTTIADTLELRFGVKAESMLAELTPINDATLLRSLQRHAVVCKSLDEFESQLAIAA
jgi:hypothetical protein